MAESRSERQPHVAVRPLKSQDDRAGQPPLPQLLTEPVICVLPLIWKHNATTNALGLERPLSSADGLAQHQDCDPGSAMRRSHRNGRRRVSAFELLQQLYSLPPSATPLLTDGEGPPARASARPPEPSASARLDGAARTAVRTAAQSTAMPDQRQGVAATRGGVVCSAILCGRPSPAGCWQDAPPLRREAAGARGERP